MRSIKHRHKYLKNKKHVNTLKQWKMKGGVNPNDNPDVLAGITKGFTPPAIDSSVVPDSGVGDPAFIPVATPYNSTLIEAEGVELPDEIVFKISKDKLQNIVDDTSKNIANYIMLYSSMIKQIKERYGTNIDKLTDIIDEIKKNDFIPQGSYIPNNEDVEMSNITAYVFAAGFFSGVGFGGGNKQKNKSLKLKNIRKNKSIKSRFNKKGGVNFDDTEINTLKNIAFNIVKEIIKQTYIINALNQKLTNDKSLQEKEKFIKLCQQLLDETKTTFDITNNTTMDQIKSEADKNIFMDDTITVSTPDQTSWINTEDQLDKNADVALNNFQKRNDDEVRLMN
jgi:hypothetical protein